MTAEGRPGGLAKSFLTKEKAVRPIYAGTGELFLSRPWRLNVMDLRPGDVGSQGSAYVASDQGIVMDMQTNPAFRMFGGEGWFQTRVSGRAHYWSPAPSADRDSGQTLTVDGSSPSPVRRRSNTG
jgi:uncharacterized protein (AIM24 family)